MYKIFMYSRILFYKKYTLKNVSVSVLKNRRAEVAIVKLTYKKNTSYIFRFSLYIYRGMVHRKVKDILP